MSICSYCDQEMRTHIGCTGNEIIIDGQNYDPIPFGSEKKPQLIRQHQELREIRDRIANGKFVSVSTMAYYDIHKDSPGVFENTVEAIEAAWVAAGYPANVNCHDCGVPRGTVHHSGCDYEECPKCLGQLIGCGCLSSAPEEEDCQISPI